MTLQQLIEQLRIHAAIQRGNNTTESVELAGNLTFAANLVDAVRIRLQYLEDPAGFETLRVLRELQRERDPEMTGG